jgi:hypothetical protein
MDIGSDMSCLKLIILVGLIKYLPTLPAERRLKLYKINYYTKMRLPEEAVYVECIA